MKLLALIVLTLLAFVASVLSLTPGGGVSMAARRGNFNPPSVAFPQQANLVNYYKLEEASGNRADSIGSATMDEPGGAVSSTTGKQGSAAIFAAAATGLQSSSFDPVPSAFTVMVWINCSALPAGSDTFFNFDDHVDEYSTIRVLLTGDLDFKPHIDDTSVSMALGSLNTWHMVVVGTTGGLGAEMRMSIDGATFTTATREAGAVPNAERWLSFGTSAAYALDEIAIWNVALTQEEVTTLWNGGAGLFLP